jgi:uncharacterized protein YuzE
MSKVTLSHDYGNDVLYVKQQNARIVISEEREELAIILDYDQNKQVVGLRILFASTLAIEEWNKIKNDIPFDMFDIVSEWIDKSEGLQHPLYVVK